MRYLLDGAIIMVRDNNDALKKELDSRYLRVSNKLVWYPKADPKEILALSNKFIGQTCHIIGKGPSLDLLSSLSSGPVIALNEAIHKVETLGLNNPLFCLTQDIHLKDRCTPINATLLLSYENRGWYRDYEKKYHFDPMTLGMKRNLPVPLSGLMAIKIAELMGCTKIEMHCFDACVGGSMQYSKTINSKSSDGGNPARFLSHFKTLNGATKLPINWSKTSDKPAIYLKLMRGLGDTIYALPFVRNYCDKNQVYLETCWPQIFNGLPVKFVRPDTKLRTQYKNVMAWQDWSQSPTCKTIDIKYDQNDLKSNIPIIKAMEPEVLKKLDFKINIPDAWLSDSYNFIPKHISFVLVRPVTQRTDYFNGAKQPKLGLIQKALDILHLPKVGVASLKENQEWSLENYNLDYSFLNGEIKIETLIALASRAKLIISPPGFMLPLGIALQVPTIIVFGGFAKPELHLDNRLNLNKFGYVSPISFCNCINREHNCMKDIPEFIDQFKAAIGRIGYGYSTQESFSK